MGGWRGPLSPGQSYKSMGLKRPGVQPTTSKEPTDQPSSPANDTLVKRGRGRPPKIKNANNEIIVKSKAISELGSKGENDIEGHSKSQDAAPSLQAAPRETRSTTKATESAVSTEPATNPKPIKRGRGRPRKVAAAPSGNSSSVPVNSQVIVPSSSNTHESDTVRPRTRQLVAPAPTKIAPAANDTVKRGRGRPRKQVLQVAEAASEASDEASGKMALTPARPKKGIARPVPPAKKLANQEAKRRAEEEEILRQAEERKSRKQAREEKSAFEQLRAAAASDADDEMNSAAPRPTEDEHEGGSQLDTSTTLDGAPPVARQLKRTRSQSQSQSSKDMAAVFGQNERLKRQRQLTRGKFVHGSDASRTITPLSNPKPPTEAASLVMRTASEDGSKSHGLKGDSKEQNDNDNVQVTWMFHRLPNSSEYESIEENSEGENEKDNEEQEGKGKGKEVQQSGVVLESDDGKDHLQPPPSGFLTSRLMGCRK